jgi:hypothetical protein
MLQSMFQGVVPACQRGFLQVGFKVWCRWLNVIGFRLQSTGMLCQLGVGGLMV